MTENYEMQILREEETINEMKSQGHKFCYKCINRKTCHNEKYPTYCSRMDKGDELLNIGELSIQGIDIKVTKLYPCILPIARWVSINGEPLHIQFNQDATYINGVSVQYQDENLTLHEGPTYNQDRVIRKLK